MDDKIIRFLVWGLPSQYSTKKLEYIRNIVPNCEFVGITSNQNLKGEIDNIPFFRREEICHIEFDYLIITSSKRFSEIRREAIGVGVPSVKILSQEIFFLSGFSWDKYVTLRNSKLSIISQGCWGGMIYSLFGLPFLSPTINLAFEDQYYVNFLKNLHKYTKSELVFSRIECITEGKITPVYRFDDDVEVHMVHYENFNESVCKWYERCQRINWDNLLVIMITENPLMAAEFDDLPFKKKICFSPFKSKLKSVCYIPSDIFMDDVPFAKFWRDVHLLAHQGFSCYDLWEILLYGRKKARWSILQ